MPHLKPPFPVALVVLVLAALFMGLNCSPRPAHADDGLATTQVVGPITEVGPPCPFSRGWNLTVLTGTPSMLPPCVSAAWHYTPDTDSWQFWGRDNQPFWNDLASFSWFTSYWLYVP